MGPDAAPARAEIGSRSGATAALPPHVQRACEWLIAAGKQYLSSTAPYRALVVDREARTHSTTTVIRLTNGRAERRFYLKTLKADAASQARKRTELLTEYRLLHDLQTRFAAFPHFGVVRPVQCFPDDLSFLMDECAGDKLDSVLAKMRWFQSPADTERSIRLCGAVGEWLRHFQRFTAPQEPGWFDLGELIAYCERRLRLIADGRHVGPAASGTQMLARLHHLAARVPRDDLALTGRHNDFRPDNMLAHDDRIIVLDFTGFTHGPRMYDFVKFWMRLDYLAFGLRVNPRSVERAKQAFIEGFGGRIDLHSPLCQMLRIANLLDKISEISGSAPNQLGRRMIERLWYRHLSRQVEALVNTA